MRWLRQRSAVLALSVRTIPQRFSSSAVAIIGIAGVVVVFVSVLSIAAGFGAALQGAGSPRRALVLRSGSDSEMTSGFEGPEADVDQAGARHLSRRPERARVGRALRHHRPAEAVQPRQARERPAARHRADRDEGPRRCLDHRGPDVPVRHQRGHRRARRARPVHQHQRRRHDRLRARTSGGWSACSRPTAASPRPRSGATCGRCRASTSGATRSRSVLARLESEDSLRIVQRLADDQPAVERDGPPRERVLRRRSRS